MVNDPDGRARRCSERMWSADAASKTLGMVIEQVAPGRACVSMVVTPAMVNGHDMCHGGLIATLADSAFAFACNSHGSVTVSSGFHVEFLASARLGDMLVAEAREVALRGRSGVYDVTVRRDDTVIAEFRGRSRSLGLPVLKEEQ